MPALSRRLPLTAAFGIILITAASSASAASINDLRDLGFRPLPDDARTIDVGIGGLIFKADALTRDGALEIAQQLVRQGRGNGRWDGDGFSSSEAASNPLTRLAVTRNERDGAPLFDTFRGEDVDENAVLVLFTLIGDIHLDGRVDGNDYFRLDADFLDGMATRGGDLNDDGRVNAEDYFLMDSSFLGQSLLHAPHAPKVYTLSRADDPDMPAVPLPSATWQGLGLLGGLAIARQVRRAAAH
jgi:hypothetical protein